MREVINVVTEQRLTTQILPGGVYLSSGRLSRQRGEFGLTSLSHTQLGRSIRRAMWSVELHPLGGARDKEGVLEALLFAMASFVSSEMRSQGGDQARH